MSTTAAVPRLTLGLPVYNGERYLAASLDALLAQTFTDFQLIISDNGSTDRTGEIARHYEATDSRVRYVHHPENRGSTFNHNYVVEQARGEFFKWVSDDDLYAPDLLQRCIDALDSRPEIVLAHAWTAFIDEDGQITNAIDYPLTTDVADPVERFRSLLYTHGGDDFYGVIRMSVLHQIKPFGSFHWADRTIVAELALQGPFYNVPDFLYFRRDHPMRATRIGRKVRRRCTTLDPQAGQPLATSCGPSTRGVPAGLRVSNLARADQHDRSLAVREGTRRLDSASCQSAVQATATGKSRSSSQRHRSRLAGQPAGQQGTPGCRAGCPRRAARE